MTEKEKAEDLINKFYPYCTEEKYNVIAVVEQRDLKCAKKLALICVDEILKNIDAAIFYHPKSEALPHNKAFYERVKSEIDKL